MILKSLATSVLSNFDFPEKIGSFKLLVTGVLVGPSKPASGMPAANQLHPGVTRSSHVKGSVFGVKSRDLKSL